jgi:hypothetical protein
MVLNSTIVTFGQAVYQTKSDAIASINNAVFDENPSLNASLFRGWVVLKGNATDLDDIDQAEFFEADRFGIRLNNKGLQQNVTTLQKAYENGTEPEIKIGATRGSVAIQDSDTPSGADIFEVKRSGGTESAFKVDTSRMISPIPSSVPADGQFDTSTGSIYIDETLDLIKFKSKDSGDVIEDYILSAGLPPSYGELYEQGLGSTITVTTAGTYYGWVTAIDGETAGSPYITFTNDSTADRLTIGASGAGVYDINVSISFVGASASIVQGAIYKNGSRQDKLSFQRQFPASPQYGVVPISGKLSLAASDYIDLRFTSDGNGDVITISNLNFSIHRV